MCVCLCAWLHRHTSPYFIQIKNNYTFKYKWVSKCSTTFHKKFNMSHRKDNCDIIVISNREKRNNQNTLFDKVMMCFRPSGSQASPCCATTSNGGKDHFQQHSGQQQRKILARTQTAGNFWRRATMFSWCAWQKSKLQLQQCLKIYLKSFLMH